MRISDWSSDVCSSDLAGGRHADLGAFQQAQALLEHCHRLVGVARVLVALLFALEGRLGLFRRLVNVAGGQIERLARLVEAAPREATAHHRGLRSPAPGRAVAVLWHLAHLPSRRTFFRPAALAPRLSHALLASAS